MQLEWWSWIVAGIVLILIELATFSFFILWFGLGALLVGLLMLAIPDLPTAAQLAACAVSSIAMAILWFRVFRQDKHKALANRADGEVIGEIGLITGSIEPLARGKVRFQRPILGSDEWACTADSSIASGERVKVVAVESIYLKVSKI